jgi:hypothetical protein
MAAAACGPFEQGIRVRAPNDRQAIGRTFQFRSGEHAMTAYLISLALAGLITIVLWEALA